MSDSAGRNRLDQTASPYLQQHADNPVHWHPWDEQALEEAKQRDVPIFLSVGYAACHWCHVMEEESFEDETVAEILNDRYVPIKVDREERPDLDRIYQTICQMVTRGGGWPLSVWLTPDGRPFYVGTYFPPESRHNRPGFQELLEGLAETWENDREEIENRADQWMQAIKGEVEDVSEPGDPPDETILESAAQSAVRSADREHGGFGSSGPKFPQPTRLQLLLRAYERTGRETFLDVATESLDAMTLRGLYDHLGGGFHRYATDQEWIVPHFEKMLYDNAEIPRVLLAAYQLTGTERYAAVAEETFGFVDRELGHPDGGFYSTLDAQSDGEEGKFYVWTPDEVEEAVDAETDAEIFCDRFGITDAGNFEGKTVLTITEQLDTLAETYDRSPEEIATAIDRAGEQLFEARSERERPARDEKILAGWNGLMISALAEGGFVLDSTHADRAVDALEFVRDELWAPDEDGGTLYRRYRDGDVAIEGYLEDYAFLARGALDCYQVTGAIEHLEFALTLARRIEADFWDEDAGTLYFTPSGGEELIARPQEVTDQSTPSSLGVAIDVLLTLTHFVSHDRFRTVAERALETHRSKIDANPMQHGSLVLAADHYAAGSLELTIVTGELPSEWRDRIGETYLPNRLVSVRPAGAEIEDWCDRLDLPEVPPIWADRDQQDGEPTVYACRSFTCSPPQTDLDEALEWAAEKL
ncbi:MAG: thioredoxin domain-containing protein [Halobacteriales archaeon]|nr:thioredoxin domain-containing protein [Halobacteriales archaeon]